MIRAGSAAVQALPADACGAAAAEAAQMQTARQHFLATISHELRTPITVLRGMLELWQDGIDRDIDTMPARMISETKQLERLVNDLMELSRLQQTVLRSRRSGSVLITCWRTRFAHCHHCQRPSMYA